MISILARREDQAWGEAVRTRGPTLAYAVRRAAGELGLGAGKTVSREQIGADAWIWDWSGKRIHVLIEPRKSRSGPSGPALSQAERRRAAEDDPERKIIVAVSITLPTLRALDGRCRGKSRGDYLEELLLGKAPARR